MNKIYLVYNPNTQTSEARLVCAKNPREAAKLLNIEKQEEYIFDVINEAYESESKPLLDIKECLCKYSDFKSLFKTTDKVVKPRNDDIIGKKLQLKKEDKSIILQNILFIGPKQATGYHFSEHMYEEFHRQGYCVSYACPEDLRDKDFDKYLKKEKRYSILKVIEKQRLRPDLIIVDECQFFWENDTSVPVWEHKREFKRPPTVNHPDLVFFWHQGLIDYFKSMFAPEWMSKVPHHKVLQITIDPHKFKPEKKKYTGITGIGYREYVDPYTLPELASSADILKLYEDEAEFKELGFKYFDTPVTNNKYWDVMPKCEALWIPISIRQYTTHRMLEAMACKTLCIFKLESWEHENVLRQMGYENGVHYIGVDKFSEMKQAYTETTNKKEIIKNAYDITMKYNTHECNVKRLVKLYKKLGFQPERFDVICPVYWVNEKFESNIENWFKEIPIRKLYLGVNNPDVKIEIEHPQIEIIDQTHFKTLGMCLADLMKRVETKWFVFMHADAEIMPNAFEGMKMFRHQKVGIIESNREEWTGTYMKTNDKMIPKYEARNYYQRERSFSGFQLMRKEILQGVIDKIEDDYIYRNEDIIFHSECVNKGYIYQKTWMMHIHQVFNQKWTFSDQETHDMQWRGIVKYTDPNEINKFACISVIKKMTKEYGLSLSHCLNFCFQWNPNWGDTIRKAYLEWEKNEGLKIE